MLCVLPTRFWFGNFQAQPLVGQEALPDPALCGVPFVLTSLLTSCGPGGLCATTPIVHFLSFADTLLQLLGCDFLLKVAKIFLFLRILICSCLMDVELFCQQLSRRIKSSVLILAPGLVFPVAFSLMPTQGGNKAQW